MKIRDNVSRDYLLSLANKDGAYGYVSAHEIINAPSAENKGEWIESKERSGHWYCSVCGGIHTDPETGKWREIFDYKYPFCPNCGAKMKGGE